MWGIEMKVTTLAAAIGLAAFLAPMTAEAAQFNFWGSNKTWDQGELVFTDSLTGISATIYAGTHDGGAGANEPFGKENECGKCVVQHGNGISVDLDKGKKNKDSHEIDGSGKPEYLRVVFSEEIMLGQVWFNSASGYDEWDMGVDNTDFDVNAVFGTDTIESLIDDDLAGTGSDDDRADFLANGGAVKGTVFTFYTDDSNDDYKLAAMNISQIVNNTNPVPLPAGLPLALAGLGAFAALRSRRAKG